MAPDFFKLSIKSYSCQRFIQQSAYWLFRIGFPPAVYVSFCNVQINQHSTNEDGPKLELFFKTS